MAVAVNHDKIRLTLDSASTRYVKLAHYNSDAFRNKLHDATLPQPDTTRQVVLR